MPKRNNYEKWLLQMLVFLIPANMFKYVLVSGALVNGRLVDYFLPKFYLSDVPIWILCCLFVFRLFKLKHILRYITIFIFISAFAGLTSLISAYPINSLWAWITVGKFLLFSAYLISSYQREQLRAVIKFPLVLALVGQSLLGIYQYINQSSLFGYIFLGEPYLNTLGIAKESVWGIIKILPYGTTAHPNILAGFISFGLLWLLPVNLSKFKFKLTTICYGRRLLCKAASYFILKCVAIGLCLVCLWLTRSQSGLYSLFIVFIIYILYFYISNTLLRLLVMMIPAFTLCIAPLIISNYYHINKYSDNNTIIIRYELNEIASNIIVKSPWLGVGLNNFIYYLPSNTLANQKTLFLQPVHNLILLILAEQGFIGGFVGLVGLSIVSKRLIKPDRIFRYGLIMLLMLIGSVDHYPLTLQSGQLMTVMAFVWLLI